MNSRFIFVALCLLMLRAPSVRAGLMAHASLDQTGPVFSYTIFNDEPANSPNYLSLWHLNVNAPIAVIGIPDAWDYFTDNATYIDFFNTDPALPYPHDVAPGQSLAGFVIQSTVTTSELQFFTVSSWDHSQDTGGPDFQAQVLAPSVVATAVPEPASLAMLGVGAFGLAGFAWRRTKTAGASR